MRHPRPLIAAALAILLAGCQAAAASPAPSSSEAEAPADAATFALTLGGAVPLTDYHSDPAASRNDCAPSSSGGWTYEYAGGDPFVVLSLSIYSGVMGGTTPSDFDLDIVAPGGQAVRLVPAGRREGAKGEGAATVIPAPGGIRINVDGDSVSLRNGADLGGTSVALAIDCPGEPLPE